MPTFLVTSKMSPALAARVEASVLGQRGIVRGAQRRRFASLVRLGTAAALIGAVALVGSARKQSQQRLAATRAALLSELHERFRSLTPNERRLGTRVAAVIGRHATSDYAGDYLADPLKTDQGLSEALFANTLYIRGALSGFANQAALTRSASESVKDSFLLCLMEPPSSHTEKALRAKARAANAAGSGAAGMAQAERLFPLLAVAPLLRPEWERAVLSAEGQPELERFEAMFRKSPSEAAVRAAKATQLLLVLDEPGYGPGPTELDGERAHDVRVLLIDLGSEQVRLRIKRHVDPSWLSSATRAEYSRAIDGCSLALRVRAALAGKAEPEAQVASAE